MRRLLIALLLLPSVASAQTIVESLSAANRSVDWSGAGVTGGIPARGGAACDTLSSTATAAQINTALAACNNGYVKLNAGTFNLTTGITFRGANNVTLRGSGPGQTILKFADSDNCLGFEANICMRGNTDNWSGNPAGVTDWTAGYAKGTTVITLGDTTGLSVNQIVVLDQLDDASDPGGVYVCGGTSCRLPGEGPPAGRTDRAQQQYVKITAIAGNSVTISPGLHMPNWKASRTPQLWWWGNTLEMSGVEDLTVDHTGGQEGAGIVFQAAYNGWVKNVKSMNSKRSHVWHNSAARIEVRNSYFYGTKDSASQSYGVEWFGTSDSLAINNIFHKVTTPMMTGNSAGCVAAYNYTTDMIYTPVASWMSHGLHASHDAGSGMNLFESNVTNGVTADLYHGTGNLATVFRNRVIGLESTKTQNTSAVNLWGYNRLFNLVGNILGTLGYHLHYEISSVNPTGDPDKAVYVLGYTAIKNTNTAGLAYDTQTRSTLVRWGNYDYFNKANRFLASEIPAGVTVPTSQTLPASMFLAAKPSWWGTMPWPAIGPDVVCGTEELSGHTFKIPAQVCYETTATLPDGTKNFNATGCYP